MPPRPPARLVATPPADVADVADLIGFRLFRLSNSIGRLAEAAARRECGLGLAEHRCLAVLVAQRETTVTALVAATRIDKGWVSRTLQRLVESGLAVSSSDESDARRRLYRPTAQGCRVARTLKALGHERQATLLRGLSAAQAAALFAALDRIQANTDAHPDAAGAGGASPPSFSGARRASPEAPPRRPPAPRTAPSARPRRST